MRARNLMFVTVLLASAAATAPALADTKAGVDAWERGDYRTAVEQWRAAATAGDADAQFNLGQAYKLGRGVPVDPQNAEEWYHKAALQGHIQSEDNYGLALFQNGKARAAIPWLEKSVARGEPRAQYILGTMLFNGVDVKKDWVRAYALTSRAAEAGLPQATQSRQQMDAYLSAGERQQGLALAGTLTSDGGQLPAQVAGAGSGSAMRGIDLPPSYTANQRPAETGTDPATPPAYGQPAPSYVPPAPSYKTPLPTTYAGPPPANRPAPVASSAPPVRRPVQAVPVVAPPAAAGRWQVQLGAFGEPGNARKLWAQVGPRFAGRSVNYVKSGNLTRVLVGPFASRAAAQAACGSVSPCVPVGP